MKTPKADSPEEMLKNHGCYWWWHAIDGPAWNADSDAHFYFRYWFKWSWQRSAFLYELKARVTGKHEFEKPWIKLTRAQRDTLGKRHPVDCTFRGISISSDAPPPKGYTRYHEEAAYNLRFSDEALSAFFLKFISDERRRLGIYPRRNEKRKNRPLSWRPIELLDIQIHQVRLLTDGERSQISKAKKLLKASI